MNHIVRFCCIVVLLLLFAPLARAQRTPLWEVVNTAAISYGSYGTCIAGEDPTSLVTIGMESGIDDEVSGSRFGFVVRRSLDSGRSWSRRYIGPRNERWRDLAHPTRTLIVVTGDTIQYLGNVSDHTLENRYDGMFMLSRDGGATWIRNYLDSNSTLGNVSMSDELHGIMTYAHVGNRDNHRPDILPDSILRTDDGWRTWSVVPVPSGVSGVSTIVALTTDRWMITTYTAVGNSWQIYLTSDGGAIWERSSNTPAGISTFSFADSLIGWGCGRTGSGLTERNRIAKTTDGGMTWVIQYDQPLGPLFDKVHMISFGDTLHGLVTGNKEIRRTTDGGVTWTLEQFPSALDSGNTFIKGVFMPAGDLGYMPLLVGFVEPPIKTGVLLRNWRGTTLRPPFFTSPDPAGPKDTFDIVVEWTPIVGAARYQLQIAEHPLEQNVFDPKAFDNLILDTVVTGVRVVLNRLRYSHGYYARVRAIADGGEESDWFKAAYLFFTGESAARLDIPRITTPASGAKSVRLPVKVVWTAVPGAATYDLQISEQNDFSTLVVDRSGLTARELLVNELSVNRVYFARVRVVNGVTIGAWSSPGTSHSFDTRLTPTIVSEMRETTGGSLRALPNPTSGIVMLDLAQHHLQPGATVKVHDARGVEVGSFALDATRTTLDLSRLAPGRYLLRLLDGSRMMTTSVTIAR